jgi:hypothetical protein
VRIKDGVVKPESTLKDFTLSNIATSILMNNQQYLILAEKKEHHRFSSWMWQG